MICILQSKLIHVIATGWEGVYVNNLLWLEGHELSNKDWYSLGQRFTRDFDEIERYEIKHDLMDQECLPQYFDQIQKDMLVKC